MPSNQVYYDRFSSRPGVFYASFGGILSQREGMEMSRLGWGLGASLRLSFAKKKKLTSHTRSPPWAPAYTQGNTVLENITMMGVAKTRKPGQTIYRSSM